jgi:hypothetical protein
MECEAFALAATAGTLTAFWQDPGILAKMLSTGARRCWIQPVPPAWAACGQAG